MNNSKENLDNEGNELKNSTEYYLNPTDGSEIDNSSESMAAEEKYLENVYKQRHGGESRNVYSFDDVNGAIERESSIENIEINAEQFEVASKHVLEQYKDIVNPEAIVSEVRFRTEERKMQDGSTAPTQEEISTIITEVENETKSEKNWTDSAKKMVNVAILTTMMTLTTGEVLASNNNNNAVASMEQTQEIMSSREKARIVAATGQGMMDARAGRIYAGDSYMNKAMQEAYRKGYEGTTGNVSQRVQPSQQQTTYRREVAKPVPERVVERTRRDNVDRKPFQPRQPQVTYRQETMPQQSHREIMRDYSPQELKEIKREAKNANRQGQRDAKSGVRSLSSQYDNSIVRSEYMKGYERGLAEATARHYKTDNRLDSRRTERQARDIENHERARQRIHNKEEIERLKDRYGMQDGKLDQRSSIPKRILDGEDIKNSEYLEAFWDFFNRK